jgi:hypothetical protein
MSQSRRSLQADTLEHLLDKRPFDHLPLDDRLDQKSREQTACCWINVVAPTVRQAKAEASGHIEQTQGDIREFFIRPAAHPEHIPPTPFA